MKISGATKFDRGFTLIELIVVIAILGTLAGISYPAIMNFQENARVSSAHKTCVDVVAAVSHFKQDHNGILPYYANSVKPNRDDQIYLITEAGKDAGMINVLTGYEEGDEKLNINNEAYMKPTLAEQPKDGLYGESVDDRSLFDPWGKPYYVVLCESLDGCIDPFTNKRIRRETCMVYSTGPDGEGIAKAHLGKGSVKRGAKKKQNAAQKAAAEEDAAEAMADNVYSWKKNTKK